MTSDPRHPERSAQLPPACHPERDAQLSLCHPERAKRAEGSRAAIAGTSPVGTARDPSAAAACAASAQDDRGSEACAGGRDGRGSAAYAACARDDDLNDLRFFDLHCHLDFADDPRGLADGLAALGAGGLSVTVTPAGYDRAARVLAPCPNVRVGAGLHPWWVEEGAAGEVAVERAVANAAASRYVGEVGLDFGPKHVATRAAQTAAFERIAAACVGGGKVLSLHAVRSASAVLDILERQGVLAGNVCIFHWFSGTSDELQRAVRAGCLFSVGPHMLASKRGRAYAQAVPAARLLLETDEPPEHATSSAEALVGLLRGALDDLAELRRDEVAALAERIARTSRAVLLAQ